MGMQTVFTVGFISSACCIFIALLDACIVRHQLLRMLNIPRFSVINFTFIVAGILVVAGLGCLGLFPWDEDLVGHYVFVGGILLGGALWLVCNSALLWRIGVEPTV